MAPIPKKKLTSPIPSPKVRAQVSLGSIDTFLKEHAYDGSTNPDEETMRLNLGLIEGTQHDRERLGPVFVNFVLKKAMDVAPFEAAPTLVTRAELATQSLKDILEDRRQKEQQGKLAEHKAERNEYVRIAGERRGTDPFIDTAMSTAEALKGHGAVEIANDVVAALGSLAQKEMREEVEAVTTIISDSQPGRQLNA